MSCYLFYISFLAYLFIAFSFLVESVTSLKLNYQVGMVSISVSSCRLFEWVGTRNSRDRRDWVFCEGNCSAAEKHERHLLVFLSSHFIMFKQEWLWWKSSFYPRASLLLPIQLDWARSLCGGGHFEKWWCLEHRIKVSLALCNCIDQI